MEPGVGDSSLVQIIFPARGSRSSQAARTRINFAESVSRAVCGERKPTRMNLIVVHIMSKGWKSRCDNNEITSDNNVNSDLDLKMVSTCRLVHLQRFLNQVPAGSLSAQYCLICEISAARFANTVLLCCSEWDTCGSLHGSPLDTYTNSSLWRPERLFTSLPSLVNSLLAAKGSWTASVHLSKNCRQKMRSLFIEVTITSVYA